MLWPTHLALGMSFQHKIKHWWAYGPLALGTHGFLDASAIYHEYPGYTYMIIVPLTVWIFAKSIQRRLWLGAVLAILPDAETGYKWLIGVPNHPFSVWQYHRWMQWPGWNYLGVYGAWWGIVVEAGLVALLTICLRNKQPDKNIHYCRSNMINNPHYTNPPIT